MRLKYVKLEATVPIIQQSQQQIQQRLSQQQNWLKATVPVIRQSQQRLYQRQNQATVPVIRPSQQQNQQRLNQRQNQQQVLLHQLQLQLQPNQRDSPTT